jgi:hypothetical protein
MAGQWELILIVAVKYEEFVSLPLTIEFQQAADELQVYTDFDAPIVGQRAATTEVTVAGGPHEGG